MADVRIIKPTSFKSYVAHIEKLQSRASNSLWFRGCGNIKMKLLPGFYRSSAKEQNRSAQQLEKGILTRFKQRSIPFLDKALSDDVWDTFFLMQHYGIPTRLLDWTENPFIALHFAVMDAVLANGSSGNFRNNICIWALDPSKWNQQALVEQSFKGDVLAPDDEPIKAYKPGSDFSGIYPICIYGSHNSRRIVAQRGVFTVFGKGNVEMERLHETAKLKNKKMFSKSCLIKLEINKRYIPLIKKSLLRYGITESTVFPDLGGLAREIKREFGY